MPQDKKRRTELLSLVTRFYEQPVARVSFELFITIMVIMFFAVFAIRPTLLTMSDLIKEIQDKRSLDQSLTQKVAALSTAQTEYLNLQSRLSILDRAIPPEPELVTALKILEKLASENQIAILTIGTGKLPQQRPTSASTPTTPPTRQNLTFIISIVGDYASIRNFISSLQSTQRMIIVESIIFTINQEQNTKALEANITVNMPYFGSGGS